MKIKCIIIPALTFGIVLTSSFTAKAEGWQQSNSTWIYLDDSGNRLKNVWKKGADGNFRWLNEAGEMAKNSWVDSGKYYVDDDGVYIYGKWKKIGNFWYHFNNNGLAAREAWQNIDSKWYYFNDEGHMLTGWILDDMYFCGADGVMLTGWQQLLPSSKYSDEKKDITPSPSNTFTDDDKNWYYFGANGKKFVPRGLDGAAYGERKVDGVRYCFSESGALHVGWANIKGTGRSSASITDYKYSLDASHVLPAMGLSDKMAGSALRITLSRGRLRGRRRGHWQQPKERHKLHPVAPRARDRGRAEQKNRRHRDRHGDRADIF